VEVGRVLADRYEILGPIAQGASSTVWEARDRGADGEGDATVAVKAVSMERAGWRAEVRDRFQQEARLLTLVGHRHLVGVRAFGETEDGYLYLVLERLTGETLADRLARPARLGWRAAAGIALELARGLAVLHERGIVHRDLKPANVILHRDGDSVVAKIIDLGIGKVGAAAADPVVFATLTATGQVLGTPEYMSHEQALGERDVDARTDVWALGVVLHEMVAGRRPFVGANVNAVLAAIRRSPPPRLDDVARGTPDAIARVVERCLSRAREGRYRDGAELAEALLVAIARGDEEEVRASRRRWLAFAAAAALIAVVGIQLAVRARHASPAIAAAPVAPTPAIVPAGPAPPLGTDPLPAASARAPAPRASAEPGRSRSASSVTRPGF